MLIKAGEVHKSVAPDKNSPGIPRGLLSVRAEEAKPKPLWAKEALTPLVPEVHPTGEPYKGTVCNKGYTTVSHAFYKLMAYNDTHLKPTIILIHETACAHTVSRFHTNTVCEKPTHCQAQRPGLFFNQIIIIININLPIHTHIYL